MYRTGTKSHNLFPVKSHISIFFGPYFVKTVGGVGNQTFGLKQKHDIHVVLSNPQKQEKHWTNVTRTAARLLKERKISVHLSCKILDCEENESPAEKPQKTCKALMQTPPALGFKPSPNKYSVCCTTYGLVWRREPPDSHNAPSAMTRWLQFLDSSASVRSKLFCCVYSGFNIFTVGRFFFCFVC